MADFSVTDLRCEYLVDPQGIDELFPRLSWRLEGRRRGLHQTAYRILVASSPELLAQGRGDRWDSGRVKSDRTTQIEYAGAAPLSRSDCHWAVQVWDDRGKAATSPPASWTVGLTQPGDWQARWIAASPAVYRSDATAVAPTATEPGTPVWFRREFSVPTGVRRATVYASARGLFELYLGGQRVGQDVLAPEWTDYDRRIHYRTYDVTDRLSPGRHVLGAVLGDGWWSGYVGWQETRGRYGSLENSLLVQLEIELQSGRRLTIATDRGWRGRTGPILSSDFMMGEVYDARRELRNWLQPRSPGGGWLSVQEVEAPGVPLVAQRSPAVQVTETIAPVRRTEPLPGRIIHDFGQNFAGWVRLRVRGRAGTRITVRHGERLNPDGTLYTENLRRARATDVYLLKGGGEETWEPRFTFHGFQYAEVSIEGRQPDRLELTGCVVHSATPPAGDFTCSNPEVNRLWRNGLWSQRSNFLSVPTDCPQRDERLGWMGDAQIFLRTATYNMDVAAFFTKWMIDIEDAQTPEGVFPDIAPRLREGRNFVGLDGLAGAGAWADAGIIVPWTLWRVYGDERIVRRHWPAMVKWLDYLERTNRDGVRRFELGNNYGDWLCIPSDTSFRTQSPMKTLLATAYWADDAAKMAEMAALLGRKEEVRRFRGMFRHVRRAFQREFLRKDGRLTVETQTAYLLALAMNLLPSGARPRAAARLVADIRRLGWHLSTGFVGIRFLNPELTLVGRSDVAYRLLLQTDYPSWLYPVRHGATTIWERWNGWTEEEGFFDPQMNSFNHYSLGSVGEWLFRQVAGIELDPAVAGFGRFVLRPYPDGRLSFVRAHYRTMHGTISSYWRRRGSTLRWVVTVPPNTVAEISIPSAPGTAVTVAGQPIKQSSVVQVRRRESRHLVCEAGAGTYVFRSRWKR